MWFFYSLFFSVWSAFATTLIKNLTKKISYLPLMLILQIFGIPLMLILVLFSGGIPQTTQNFYLFMFASATLDTIAFVSFFAAISKSEISLVTPLASFGPIFTAIIAIYTLKEIPNTIGVLGIFLIVFGAYLLNAADIKQGVLAPFKNLFRNKGVLLFLLATLMWSITPIFQKQAIFETSPRVPLYASFWGLIFVTIFTSLIVLPKALKEFSFVKNNISKILLYASGSSLAQLAAYTAFSLAFVGYTTAVFRTSALFIVIFGGIFLKEKRFKERLLGTLVMILGVI
ncbi:MAG: hypothetical protein A3B43_01805, partial [Candidatus Levybacteria bacterium RIFCSPLOWO2_01_FULL_38_120]